MTSTRNAFSNEKGFALFYMAVFLTLLCIFVGLAVDTGRAYVVQAQLSKAVDGAALGAARMLNSADPRQEAATIYRANFPNGWMSTTSSTSPSDAGFYDLQTVAATGQNIVTINATAVVPTTFMRLANFQELTVRATGQATRRMVDLSLVLDVSGSIGWRWPYVRDAARTFVDSFDAASDRIALVFYSNGARVIDAMPAGRGFDKARVMADIPNSLPGGSTNMAEGMYRGWDEVRSVPNGQQSGLRVIVFFTDGATNGLPGIYPGMATSRSLRTTDFPDRNDPDNMTSNTPTVSGLYDTQSGVTVPSAIANQSWLWSDESRRHTTVLWLPLTSSHSYHRSAGIPTSFPLKTNTLMVDGAPQDARRPLRNTVGANVPPYRTTIFNINNAARNLVEYIANEARADDDGDYPIRIYTIGMGELVRLQLGTRPETSESMLKRIANDLTSPDRNAAQLEGKYYFAATPDDVGPAFAALQNQIIRLTK
jgi:Flp pilus assembly protein TadG